MRFAIVVPNLNYAIYLRDCLDSLEKQVHVKLSVAIVDGGSNDNSLEIIKEYCDRNNWVYEVAIGLGQAASIARGFDLLPLDDDTVLGWLNSDDVMLRRDSLKIIDKLFCSLFSADVVSLGGYYIDKEFKFIRPVVYDYHPLLRGDVFARGGGFLQPSTFWRNCVYDSVKINFKYKYLFDGEFFLRMRACGFSFYHNPRIHISGYRIHGENLSLNVPSRRVMELSIVYKNILNRKYSAFYLSILYRVIVCVDFIPLFAPKLKLTLYVINNILSYITRYRIPSI